MKALLVILLELVVISSAGCARTIYWGSEWGGFDGCPVNPVSVSEAIAKARPYLDETFALRSSTREHRNRAQQPVIHVTLRGKYYYIVRDNYPSYSPGFYLHHAVRVHKTTGQLIAPR